VVDELAAAGGADGLCSNLTYAYASKVAHGSAVKPLECSDTELTLKVLTPCTTVASIQPACNHAVLFRGADTVFYVVVLMFTLVLNLFVYRQWSAS
jgi:hypothetical protein